ncbi:nuclear transport factor 2 family protein [Rhodocytophaga aerolata]|uniref:Nuclear transport factor 2 family protein n=1 Tax=Rhodocytophaga aerolata TaxID=455078 RepID=A0ABT8RHM3_9BACT|nr:nuclear transport factor 2 family protein [Rhodocytophaga aerolata]MDO1451596.1 nuclear transport factor 2 family protein [Rhodocytophaga aerolata]
MRAQHKDLIKKAYAAFNSRDIARVLSTFHPDVQWPKAFEGGYVSGHDEIRKYWTRQWSQINPRVKPTEFNERENGTLEVSIHQRVKDMQGNLIFDGAVKHIYTIQDNLLVRMDIELA